MLSLLPFQRWTPGVEPSLTMKTASSVGAEIPAGVSLGDASDQLPAGGFGLHAPAAGPPPTPAPAAPAFEPAAPPVPVVAPPAPEGAPAVPTVTPPAPALEPAAPPVPPLAPPRPALEPAEPPVPRVAPAAPALEPATPPVALEAPPPPPVAELPPLLLPHPWASAAIIRIPAAIERVIFPPSRLPVRRSWLPWGGASTERHASALEPGSSDTQRALVVDEPGDTHPVCGYPVDSREGDDLFSPVSSPADYRAWRRGRSLARSLRAAPRAQAGRAAWGNALETGFGGPVPVLGPRVPGQRDEQ